MGSPLKTPPKTSQTRLSRKREWAKTHNNPLKGEHVRKLIAAKRN